METRQLKSIRLLNTCACKVRQQERVEKGIDCTRAISYISSRACDPRMHQGKVCMLYNDGKSANECFGCMHEGWGCW